MNPTEFLNELMRCMSVIEVETALQGFQRSQSITWLPVGRENNRGTVEVSSDPARSAVERLTNGMDAVLELEHDLHRGLPECRSPREASIAWLNVPEKGLSAMTPAQRRTLAQRVSIRMETGEGRESRILEIRDHGIGIKPERITQTILSLNASNKLQKHYLAGAYGQGGSSTFAFSRYSLIACRCASSSIGFTLVKFLDLPAEQFKTGHYVYFVGTNQMVPIAEISLEQFPAGCLVKHFGYDLSGYASPLGPNSLYGSLNTILFDPAMPIWFDNRVHDYRRVIKGSRNALNGAIDDGDERTGPSLRHNMPLFYVSLGDFGLIGIEYWVLEQPTKANKRPSAAFVNPAKPIILTLNGQNQGEFSQLLIRKDAELPFLSQRLICHVDCNQLSPTSKRQLFVSNREAQREVKVRELIQQEVIKAFKSDDVLAQLNDQARQLGAQEKDENAIQQMRTEVARLLRIHGVDFGEAAGTASGSNQGETRSGERRRSKRQPEPIELHEPPTFIRFLWEKDEPITFYFEQRRYLRIVTDANSTYHTSSGAAGSSRINFVVGDQLAFRGSTPLQGGRLRAIVEGPSNPQVGYTGMLRVELTRPGLTVLSDERPYKIVSVPPSRPADRRTSLPPFRPEPVNGPDDPKWTQLAWPDSVASIASEAEMEDGTLVIYYSTAFPKFVTHRENFERQDPTLAISFTKRYEIWLCVHSLLYYQDQQLMTEQKSNLDALQSRQEDPEMMETRERQERCRIAIISSLFASREMQFENAKSNIDVD